MAKVLPVLVFLILVASFVFFFPVTKIKKVNLNEQYCLSAKSADEMLIGRNFFGLDENKSKDKLKNKFICINEAKITKQFPSTVNVKITTKEPVAKIGDTNLFVAEDGNIIPGDKEKPTLYLPSEIRSQLSSKITDETTLFALKLAALLIKTDYTVAAIRLTSEKDIAIYDHQGIIALFTNQKQANTQVDSLQQVLAMSKISSSKIAKIDLRFDKPVVQFNVR